LQGDASIVALFDTLGVNTSFTSSGITLTKKRQIHTDELFHYDFTPIPDMAQTVVVTCAMLHIPFRFTGLHTLKIKETDRLFALKTELQKLGFQLEILNDNTLEWNGERIHSETSPVITTYGDHRMAMAFAPVSCCIENGIRIANPDVVSKSYPSFWDDLRKANFIINRYLPE
jgi:3-phosphoshikimate 1-carboxyvinyltransferase